MEALEIVLYFILTIILIALVGVLTWLIYDYFKYKKEQGDKNTNIINYSDRNDNTIQRDLHNEMNKLLFDLNSTIGYVPIIFTVNAVSVSWFVTIIASVNYRQINYELAVKFIY